MWEPGRCGVEASIFKLVSAEQPIDPYSLFPYPRVSTEDRQQERTWNVGPHTTTGPKARRQCVTAESNQWR